MTSPYVVPETSRLGHRLSARGSLAHELVHMVLADLQQMRADGANPIELDFTELTTAFPEGMVPLLAGATRMRAQGTVFRLLLPRSPMLASLFANANWAHYLDPANYPPSRVNFSQHLPVQNFRDHTDQDVVISRLLDVIFRSIRLTRANQDALEWSIAELTENVITHSESPVGGFVQATSWKNSVQFTISDAGVGILGSLSRAYPTLDDDCDAIVLACEAGVTGRPKTNAGNGLAGSRFLAIDSGGVFGLTSGAGNLRIDAQRDGEASVILEDIDPEEAEHGTTVTVRIGNRSSFSASESIGRLGGKSHAFYSRLDAIFDPDGKGILTIRVADTARNATTRLSGRELRSVILNALSRSDSGFLILDWTGILSPTSSFVDEALGKLVQAADGEALIGRIRVTGASSMSAAVIQAALTLRAGQVDQSR